VKSSDFSPLKKTLVVGGSMALGGRDTIAAMAIVANTFN